MAIAGVDPKCYILALFVRDDGARFLLGEDPYEFKDKQLHFQQNTIANDVVEVQGNDGYLLAGQVRRPGTQSFDGYVANGTDSKAETEEKRRAFLQFFRRSHFYKIIYIFPNGTAIQRKQGFLVDDPTVQELYQQYPEYHVALNFEDVNYYTYEEDDEGHEIYAEEAVIRLVGGGATGGLIWDEYGVVWENPWDGVTTVSGTDFQVDNLLPVRVPISEVELQGDTYQQTYSGKNLYHSIGITTQNGGLVSTLQEDGKLRITGTATGNSSNFAGTMTANLPAGTYTFSITKAMPFRILLRSNDNQNHWVIEAGQTRVTQTITSALTSLWVWGYNLASGTTYDETVGFQLESGSSATSFEPYVGGIPSPNPDYPQEVQVVTGEQTVEVTGKNLLNATTTQTSRKGIVYSGDTGQVYLDGTITTTTSLNWNNTSIKAGTYKLMLELVSGSITSTAATPGAMFYIYGGNITQSPPHIYLSSVNPRVSKTITLSDDSNTAHLNIWCRNTETFSNAIIKYQLVKWTEDDYDFEPYKRQEHIVDLTGKNLLDLSTLVAGYVSSNGTFSTAQTQAEMRSGFIKVQPNTAYTFSIQETTDTYPAWFGVGLYSSNNTSSFIRQDTNTTTTATSITFTTSATTNYVVVSARNMANATEAQLEKGSSVTSYETPYNVELCKIVYDEGRAVLQDYIYKKDDGWYIHNMTVKTTLNGTENWSLSNATSGYTRGVIGHVGFPTQLGYCNEFTPRTGAHGAYEYVWFQPTSIGGLYIQVKTDRLTDNTLAAFKAWLSNNPTEVVYALATPTDTKITNADLVAQLEALDSTRLFVGENNILVSSTGSNLPATLQFDYYTRWEALGAEWEEGGTKGPTIVDVDAIDNTYPVWELTGPAVNPTLSVLTTNTTLTYNGTITASQTLVIDMFNKTATLNGTSVIGNISGDWVYMAPGTNRVAYTTGNTDAPDSKISWQEVVG